MLPLCVSQRRHSEGEQAAALRLLTAAGLGPGSLALQGDLRAPGLREALTWARRMTVRFEQ